MNKTLLGLSFAMVVLFTAKAVNFTLDPPETDHGHRLRHIAWFQVALGILFGFSPPRISDLIGQPIGEPWHDILRLLGLILMVTAAMTWAAARGYLMGGSHRDVRRGLIANFALVMLCLIAAFTLQ